MSKADRSKFLDKIPNFKDNQKGYENALEEAITDDEKRKVE